VTSWPGVEHYSDLWMHGARVSVTGHPARGEWPWHLREFRHRDSEAIPWPWWC